MPNHEPKIIFDTFSAAPFALAQFQLLYDSWVSRIIRLTILLAGASYVAATAGWEGGLTNLYVNLPSYIWGIFVFWEIAYYYKVRKLRVATPIGENNNFAASFSGNAAKILLQGGADLSKIFSHAFDTFFAKFVLAKTGLTEKDLKKEDHWGSFEEFLGALKDVAAKEGWPYVTKQEVLAALAIAPGPFKKALFESEVKEEDLRNILFWASSQERTKEAKLRFWKSSAFTDTKGIAHDWAYGYTLALERYGRDLTADLATGRIRPYLVGRDRETDIVQKILARSAEKNVLLIGEAGVGKTSVVQALALASLRGKTLPQIRHKRFLQLDLTSILSSAAAGEVEQRVKDLLTDAERAGNIILVIPDVQYLAGAGEGIAKNDLTGLFLVPLQGDRLQVIALVDHQGYKKYLENHRAFLETFEELEIPQSNSTDTIRVLEQMAPELEERHKVNLTYGAIKTAVEMSNRYLTDKELPGKAIELLDEAAVEASVTGKSNLTASDIAIIITRKTGVPVGKASEGEKEKLLHLEDHLHKRIVGQDSAIVAVSNALRRARAGLRDEKRPIGVFLFLGPTGVGKTETAKSLAEAYFGSEKNMVRLDMSEYQTVGDQAKLLGSAGESGNFTEAVRSNPFTLILLDEIEKANHKILDTFLQVFSDGRLTDGTGRTVDFTNTIIIATSNAGAEQIRQFILQKDDLQEKKGSLLDHLQKDSVFKPEFLNRFDEIVLFRPLTEKEVFQIVRLMLKGLAKQLSGQDINLEITDTAVKKISSAGFDPVFGARPLRRYIQDHVEGILAKKLLEGEVKRGDTITLDLNDLGDLATETFR